MDEAISPAQPVPAEWLTDIGRIAERADG